MAIAQAVLMVSSATRTGGELRFNCEFALPPLRYVKGGLLLGSPEEGELYVRAKISKAQIPFVIQHSQNIGGKKVVGTSALTDPVLSGRMWLYLNSYYGRRYTNCSTFTEYLRTGGFTECTTEKNAFMFSGGMNMYKGQPIETGDSVCLLYYKKYVHYRKAPPLMRARYRAQEKHAEDWSKIIFRMDNHVSSEEILSEYRLGIYADFHFMICVGSYGGQPLFLQQMGAHDPKNTEGLGANPIIATVGKVSASPHLPIAHILIKKGIK